MHRTQLEQEFTRAIRDRKKWEHGFTDGWGIKIDIALDMILKLLKSEIFS